MKIRLFFLVLFGLLNGLILPSELKAHSCSLKYAKNKQISQPKIKSYSEKEIQEFETKLVELINLERAKLNLKALTIWKSLTYCAKEHSQNMANEKVAFGHGGFEFRAESMKKLAKLKSFGENVAYCYNIKDPLKAAVEGWMDSPGHKENILSDYEETGIGIAYSSDGACYMTQLFAKRFKK